MKRPRVRPSEPVGDGDSLQRETMRVCNQEYEARWNEVFLGGASSIGGTLIRRVEGLHGRAETERSAVACYERLRKRSGHIQAEVTAWLSKNEYLTGHVVAAALASLAHPSRARMRGSDLPPVSELVRSLSFIPPPAPSDGFSDTTWLLFEEIARPPISQAALNREVAVILILMGEAPAGWKAYDRRLSEGEVVTPAVVIKDVEKRVRDVAGPDAGAIRTR